MGAQTKIEWTDNTFNPWKGCQKVSPGCKNCYAEAMEKRFAGAVFGPLPKGTRVLTSDSYWGNPVKWNTLAAKTGFRQRVFCASEADVFEDWTGPITAGSPKELKGSTVMRLPDGAWWVPGFFGRHPDAAPLTMNDLRAELWKIIGITPMLDWLLLTKRPENVLRMAPKSWAKRFPGNVWIGTSIENGDYVGRADELRKVPAAIRFLSIEPLVGNVSDSLDLSGIHWMIVGGESGQGSRDCDVQEIRALVQLARAHDVAPFVKQLGAKPIDRFKDAKVRILDSKGGDWVGYDDLRIREYPTTEVAA